MLSQPAHDLLSGALTDPRVIARYEAKIIRPTTRECHFWVGALHARTGHGRFFVGTTAQRLEVCLIAHRFGWARRHGVVALDVAPVLAHTCDEPSCQNPEHLEVTTSTMNLDDFYHRVWTPGSPLRDVRGPAGRARAIRAALRAGDDLETVLALGTSELDRHQLSLF